MCFGWLWPSVTPYSMTAALMGFPLIQAVVRTNWSSSHNRTLWWATTDPNSQELSADYTRQDSRFPLLWFFSSTDHWHSVFNINVLVHFPYSICFNIFARWLLTFWTVWPEKNAANFQMKFFEVFCGKSSWKFACKYLWHLTLHIWSQKTRRG